jgi:hypothetical protein
VTLPMYVVTANTSDFPGRVVVRKQYIGTPPGADKAEISVDPEPMIVAPDLAIARDLLHALVPGLHVIPRSRRDDPVIVESWI